MKQLSTTACAMLLSIALFAQETSIEVQGMAEYTREVDKYQAEITVSPMNYYSYDQRDKPTLEELTQQFFKQMEENGFDRNRFKPSDKPKYYSSQQDEAVIYLFETTSEEELTKLVNVKRLNGIYVSGGQTIFKPLADPEKVVAVALQDAKENAATVAGVLGKTVGRVISVADQSRIYASQAEGYYDGEKTAKYYILVKFLAE